MANTGTPLEAALSAIDTLIDAAKSDRGEHRIAERYIEAAASAIRIQALKDARKAVVHGYNSWIA